MKQEDKELLWKDLCARLPYKIYAQIPDEYSGYTSAIESIDIDGFVTDFEGAQIEIENIRPYLFPLSSMTDEQIMQAPDYMGVGDLENLRYVNGLTELEIYPTDLINLLDWLNKNHFDYRGLIEKGLAIDATGLDIY